MFVTKALARLTMCAGLMALASRDRCDPVHAQQTVNVGATDIGGTVVSAAGPEAGVWVIAETTELPTKFARIVVTDDQGRYLVPDLPTANYNVWVRGYGLVDSPKVIAKPGQLLNLTAVPAPNEAEARALLSGDLLVRDDENPAGRRVRRQERHSGQAHAGRLAEADEEHRLHRLSPARPGSHPHRFRPRSASSIPAPTPGCGASSPASPASR